MSDAGRLREDALLNAGQILKTKASQLPNKPGSWWQKLSDMLNHLATTDSLVKMAIDQEDEQTLVVFGVL